MYTLIKSITARQLFTQQMPIFVTAFVIAELFYKFHSFMLETGAFLITWFVLDVVSQWILAYTHQRQVEIKGEVIS